MLVYRALSGLRVGVLLSGTVGCFWGFMATVKPGFKCKVTTVQIPKFGPSGTRVSQEWVPVRCFVICRGFDSLCLL